MTDSQLTIAAAAFEIGIPVAIALLAWRVAKFRRFAVVIMGALTPAIVAMVWLSYEQFAARPPGNMAGAGWVMGFVAYVALLIGGSLLSFLPRPSNFVARYAVGLAMAPVSFGALLLV